MTVSTKDRSQKSFDLFKRHLLSCLKMMLEIDSFFPNSLPSSRWPLPVKTLSDLTDANLRSDNEKNLTEVEIKNLLQRMKSAFGEDYSIVEENNVNFFVFKKIKDPAEQLIPTLLIAKTNDITD